MTGPAQFTVDGNTKDYPVLQGTIGPEVIDIRKLYSNTGRFTFDPGFTSTAACESKITYIDGDAGVCRAPKAGDTGRNASEGICARRPGETHG